MVVFGSRKYACLSCIRGHRSSSCEHRDRILLQIRKPGRKPQTEPQGRFALVWKDKFNPDPSKIEIRGVHKSKPLSESEYKLVHVPAGSEDDTDCDQNESDRDDVVITEKYMFVHVGDNLFRRELRPEYVAQQQKAPTSTSHESMTSSPEPLNPNFFESQHSSSSLPTKTTQPCHSIPDSNALTPIQSNNTQARTSFAEEKLRAPLVIGPMQYQNDFINRQENIFNELGMTTEEANLLWPDSPANFSFASQCVLPGQCQCGDGCECPDCHEHHLARRKSPE